MGLWKRVKTLWYLSTLEVGLTDYKTGEALDKGHILDVAKRLKTRSARPATIVERHELLDQIKL